MVKTFSYRTEIAGKEYQHIIHSIDIKKSVEKWIKQIEDLQSKNYSFDKTHVENIKRQFLDGKLNLQTDQEPYYLTYKIDDIIHVVNIDLVNKGAPDLVASITYLTTEEGGRN